MYIYIYILLQNNNYIFALYNMIRIEVSYLPALWIHNLVMFTGLGR